ncbi:MAG TPA: chloride channel protein [Chryseosolibacter sp.]|nr:chloride channel protein [Chryseosolibacter sp.]
MLAFLHSLIKKPILYLRKKLSDRNFFILSAILVGLTSGAAAIILKYIVHTIATFVTYSSRNYENLVLFACFPLVGIVLTVIYLKFFLKERLRRGSAEIVYAVMKNSSTLPRHETYAHLVTSGLTVGFGGSVGLESPMVSTGSAIGANYAEAYGLSYKERTILLGCGAAAGIAAAFNAPIAGVLFVIEVLLADVAASAFIPLIIAAATGALMSKIVLQEGVILSFSLQQPFNYHNVPYYIILGLAAGFVALFYSRAFAWVDKKITGIRNNWTRVAVGGTLLFVLLLLFPPLFGEGYDTIKQLSVMDASSLADASALRHLINSEGKLLMFLGALVVLKTIAAAITVGSGGNGGSFAPSLFIGAYLGYVFSRILNITGVTQIPESNFTLVAMAGILSGVFYAPLTAIFLIAELTGGYELMIPLMIVSSLSLIVNHLFEPLSPEQKRLSKKMNLAVESRDQRLLSRLDIRSLIETNFASVHPNESLRSLIRVIASSSRNAFPVVGDEGKLEGIVHLDKVRKVIFDASRYDAVYVRDLMDKPAAVINADENLLQAIEKFDKSDQWNLPVVEEGKYIGFLSKSSILTRYRKELQELA